MKHQSTEIGFSKRLLAIFIALFTFGIAVFVFPNPVVHAAPKAAISVDTISETSSVGHCTLRDAINAANTNSAIFGCIAGSGADAISFSTNGTIVLTGSLPAISQDLTINGGNVITVSGNSLYHIFDINPSVTVNLPNISIQKGVNSGHGGAISNSGVLNIDHASFISNTSTSGQGGAIQNNGVLTVASSTFSLNRSTSHGGAIDNDIGSLLVVNSTFTNNATIGGGGGGAIDSDAPLTIIGSTFTNNSTANNRGGAVWVNADSTVISSTFSNNHAKSSGPGGGMAVLTGIINLNNSSYTANIAENGGGIIIEGGTVFITNTTVSGNFANSDGGGIAATSGTTTLNNVAITNNVADNNNDGTGDGGGIKIVPATTVNVKNTIIAGNFDTPGNLGSFTKHPDCSGALMTLGNNLLGNNTGCSGLTDGVSGDKVGTGATPKDAKLGPLGYYGSATLVHSLLTGSPALNAGNNSTCASTDQRGVTRALTGGDPCDMGAYEGVGYGLYLPLIEK